jgi:Mg2+ and Co2+ transporter CorA
MSDYQSQLTTIYNKLSAINGILAKLALMSNVNTVQTTIQTRLNTISDDLDTVSTNVENIQLAMSDLIVELRSK